MKQKSKKIIAKEILILSSIVVIALMTYGVLHLMKNYKQEKFEKLKKQRVSLLNEIQEIENKSDEDHGSIAKNINVKLQKLYQKINQKYNVGTFNEYIIKIYKSDERKILYEALKKDYDLGTFEKFEESLGFNKVFETPNGSKVKAKELMDRYGKRFDTLLDQKYLTPINYQNVIQLKEGQLTSYKKYDLERLEELKKDRIAISEKIKNSDHPIDVNNVFYSIIINLVILAYPFRLFVIGIKWALKMLETKKN